MILLNPKNHSSVAEHRTCFGFAVPASKSSAGEPFWRSLLVFAMALFLGCAVSSAQVKIIIDTDTATDCDDAGALAVAHSLQNRGECTILAVITNNKDPYSIGGIDAINTWYGRGNIPLGAYKGTVVGKTSSYGAIAQNTALYGHDVTNSSQVPDALTTYRAVLAAQADASVVIVSIGWLNNLEALLKSPADAISPLTGTALVARKVKAISIMGGYYPSGSEYNFTSNGSAPSTKYTVDNWPETVPMMFQGYEIGDGVSTGPSLKNTPVNNPVRKAYETMYSGINGRPSWDPCAVLYAVRGLSTYWTQEAVGSNLINTNGTNAWQTTPDKNQAYSKVLMSDSSLATVLADLMDDPPQPPVKVIFDTDFSTDCDDPGALAVLHALADNDEVEILATGASTRLAKAPGAIDVVNTYYGRPDLPVSATKTGPTFASTYADYLYDNFPHDTPLTASVADAISSYRQVLAAQPDNSVVFISVGYLTNVAGLLQSPPDAFSPLTGQELVAAKVKEWACMGGNFWTTSTDNVNFTRDTASAYYAVQNFPGKITFIPREVASVPSPLRVGEELNETPLSNPVRIAYHKYFNRTTGIDRHCADLATVLYAVRGKHDYWDVHTSGSMNITPAGTFTWDEGLEKDHNYLVMKGGYGVYSNETYIESVLGNLLKQSPAALGGVQPPVISSHPLGLSIAPGQTATFSVSATATPAPTYQWQKDGLDIPGATSSVYITPAATISDSGSIYRVVIANSAGSVTSNGATLMVGVGELLAHYNFDETSGTIFNRGSGGITLDLTNTGGAAGRDNSGSGGYGGIAYAGYGTAFDVPASGDGAYHSTTSAVGGGALTAAAVTQSNLQGADGSFSYEAFISLSSTAGEQNILSHDGSGTRGFLFRVNAGTLSFFDGAASFVATIPTSGAHGFAANGWYHVAVTYDGQAGVAGNLKFYWTALNSDAISANLIGSGTLSADLAGSASNNLGVGTTTRNFFRFELGGLVDEVRISSVALSAGAFDVFMGAMDPGVDTFGDGIPDAWELAHGLDPAVDNSLGDPDGNGIPHLMEFALGIEPYATEGLPLIGPENSLLTLTVGRNPDADHLLFVPEVSGDLVTWYSDAEHVTILEETPSLLRASDNTPLTGAAPRFLRLRVVVSPE